METPAGWYDDGSGRQRWWDGQQWTDHFADRQVPPPGAPSTMPAQVAPQYGVAPVPQYGAAVPEAQGVVGTAEPRRKPHVLSFIALGIAVLGLIFACVPGALVVGWVLLPLAFILSIVALFLKGRKWPAIVGLIVSVIGTIVGFIVFFAVFATAALEAVDSATPDPAPAASSAPSTEPQPEESATAPSADSKFAVTIDSSSQVQDYEGKPALIVDYTFTNNSTEDVSFMFAVQAQAFQDGVELESAIIADGSVDPTSMLNDVKPGATTTVQWAYVLTSTSEVTVEVKELISLSDTLIATKQIPIS